MEISLKAGHTRNASIGSRRRVRTYPSSSIDIYILHLKPRRCAIVGYTPAGMRFNSVSMRHTLDMFHVCYEVMSVDTAELKSTMCNSDQRNMEKSVDHGLVVEQRVAGAAERSGLEKNKGKIAISSHYKCSGARMCVRSLVVRRWLEITEALLVGSENTNEMSLHSGTAWTMRGGWRALHSTYTVQPPPGQRPKGICQTDMVVWVIVSDTQGGWTQTRANSL